MCKHGKNKRYCRPCRGSAWCVHKKLRSQCRECRGVAFCVHGKRKVTCATCKISAAWDEREWERDIDALMEHMIREQQPHALTPNNCFA